MNRSEQNSHRGRSLCFISHKNHSCVLPPQYCCFYRLQDGSIDGVTDQPVVSLSLGNACDFLIEDDDAFFDDDDGGGDSSSGGRARALVPLSVRLESGDVILFGGPARRCKHSVARIFPDTCPAPLLELHRAACQHAPAPAAEAANAATNATATNSTTTTTTTTTDNATATAATAAAATATATATGEAGGEYAAMAPPSAEFASRYTTVQPTTKAKARNVTTNTEASANANANANTSTRENAAAGTSSSSTRENGSASANVHTTRGFRMNLTFRHAPELVGLEGEERFFHFAAATRAFLADQRRRGTAAAREAAAERKEARRVAKAAKRVKQQQQQQ
jgi:hypothetical protein